MGKLYELLAVEPDLRKQASEFLKKAIGVCGKEGLFTGQTITYHPLNEEALMLPPEVSQVTTTVEDALKETERIVGQYIDATVQKEVSNQGARADVVIDGNVFLEGLSATALLNLESRLEELAKFYKALPTLPSTEQWEYNDSEGCYQSDTRIAYRTKKVMRNHVKAEATEQHPAQVEVYNEDVPEYQRETVIYSGAIKPTEKNAMLLRLGKLQRAVKKARQRANAIEVADVEVSAEIFNYING